MQVQDLFELFNDYNPTAVGVNSVMTYGWVCLPSLEALQTFVESVNRKEDKDGDIWTVVTDYDLTVVPVRDWSELRSNQKARVSDAS
ncbi:hypothetical protein M441DRAFT_126963 [Trichoderma asperellum CBS 433.97]|uniref:Uncharacterized protein n=1 Tax=Trichoderma asperellum (strain ATCC 204424 / CBS 433.97 / NBRC 101777) TaxID=1042311 RepID=A0A2T3ZP04_TRIA4|nr:hypothetical protein M441DRAFT_126963 [Trichoderma asperellum CBS 433.97]PTB46529.1 hypothetical protein M441DRAFT_126963 [Trichoderma asperellum CBS 433.97]